MKWLFALLVIMNVVFFGARALQKQEAELVARRDEAGAKIVQAAEENPQPWAAAENNQPPSFDWLNDNGGAREVKDEPTGTGEEPPRRSEAERMPQEQAAAVRRQTDTAPRPPRNALTPAEGSLVSGKDDKRRCTPTASVSIPEDDYHRIKGLLSQWSHVASRRVEQKASGKAKSRSGAYAVWIPIQGDAAAQMQEIGAKGFNTVLMEGGISVGIRADQAQAQALLARAKSSGYPAQLRELNSDGQSAGGGQSVAKMYLTFMTVSDKDIPGIQSVVGRYGALQRNNCR